MIILSKVLVMLIFIFSELINNLEICFQKFITVIIRDLKAERFSYGIVFVNCDVKFFLGLFKQLLVVSFLLALVLLTKCLNDVF